MTRETHTAEQCSAMIYGRHSYQCTRKATVEHEGRLYCTQHGPAAVAARRKKQDDIWEAQRAKNDAQHRRRTACLAACNGISTEALEAGVIEQMKDALECNIQFLLAWQFEYGKTEYMSPEHDEQRELIWNAVNASQAALASLQTDTEKTDAHR